MSILKKLIPVFLTGLAVWGQSVEQAREDYAFSVGVQAYIYGFPLVVMGVTRHDMLTNAPVNRFAHVAALATHESKAVVSPNVDTLYSVAWLDLAKGPVKLHVPDMAKRYFVLQFLDAATNNFAYVGTRVTGQQGGDWTITGPEWKGRVVAGARRIASPTDTVWIIARILVDGPQDIPNVRQIQQRMTLGLAGEKGEGVTPAPGTSLRKPVLPQMDAMNVQEFFGSLARMLQRNPPPARDEAIMIEMRRIGLSHGGEFDSEKLDGATRRGLTRALEAGRNILAVRRSGIGAEGEMRNGWSFGNNKPWGTDYLRRALTARGGLGALDPEEALYPSATKDSAGEPLTGSRRYTLHFDRGQTPAVNAFWSLTMYGPDHFLAANPISRYAIGDRTRGLSYGADGSLELAIQHEAPAGRESNWLPAPEGEFSLALRLYLPKPEAVDGRWKPPQLRRLD